MFQRCKSDRDRVLEPLPCFNDDDIRSGGDAAVQRTYLKYETIAGLHDHTMRIRET